MLRKEKDFNKYQKHYSLFRFQVQSLYSGIAIWHKQVLLQPNFNKKGGREISIMEQPF